MPHYHPPEFRRAYDEDPEKTMRFYESVERVHPQQPFWLHPGQFAIGCTLEYVHLDATIAADLEGMPSRAREGLDVHCTAGLIHLGHSGTITFELHNVGTHAVALYSGTKIARLRLYKLDAPPPSTHTPTEELDTPSTSPLQSDVQGRVGSSRPSAKE